MDATRHRELVAAICEDAPAMDGAVDALVGHFLPVLNNASGANTSSSSSAARRCGGLLCGPPGSGKTTLARGLCKHLPVRWSQTISAPDVFQAALGESEAKLSSIFREAGQHAPSLLVIDEIDAIAGSSRAGGSSIEVRLCAHLFALLDALPPCGVCVCGISSRPAALNPALLAPGRLEAFWPLPMPSAPERLAMLQFHARAIPLCACEACASAQGGPCAGRGTGDERPPVQELPSSSSSSSSSCLPWVSKATVGFVAADLAQLCRAACTACLAAAPAPAADHDDDDSQGERAGSAMLVRRAHFVRALEQTRPALLHTGQQQQQQQHLLGSAADGSAFGGLGGVDAAVAQLRDAVLLPLERAEAFAQIGERPPRGVLLSGPPGTGKTSMASAIGCAVHGKAHFIQVVCSELISKLVGETERAITDLFARARAASPCIIFLDHLEALAPVRGHDTSSERTFDRVLSTLLTEIEVRCGAVPPLRAPVPAPSHRAIAPSHPRARASDHGALFPFCVCAVQGVSTSADDQVTVLAATANVKWLDPSILRPGRFDVQIRWALWPVSHLCGGALS
jgi:transitional endoplasmic reticulum ATPase